MAQRQEPRWSVGAENDVIGQDRLIRSLLRVVARLEPGAMVAVHGAPGSGKGEFVRRLAWLAGPGRNRGIEPIPGLHPMVVWFDAWEWSKQGQLVAGLIAALVSAADPTGGLRERAREVIAPLGRLHLDGRVPEGPGGAFAGLGSDPVQELRRGFLRLLDMIRGGRPGRVLFVVEGIDLLSPGQRWELIDGMRLLFGSGADACAVLSVGREAALGAVAHHHGNLSPESARRVLDDYLAFTMTVPTLEVRRVGSLLRDYIGHDVAILQRSFGRDSTLHLTAAVAHRPLGSPRFLRRLAVRAVLLAEYAAEMRASRELSEAQWAWVIISERWPDFRRYMIRGGRQRWIELNGAVVQMQERGADGREPGRRGPLSLRTGISSWLEEDPILSDYLRLHASGFARNGEGIFWLENLMLAAGL